MTSATILVSATLNGLIEFHFRFCSIIIQARNGEGLNLGVGGDGVGEFDRI